MVGRQFFGQQGPIAGGAGGVAVVFGGPGFGFELTERLLLAPVFLFPGQERGDFLLQGDCLPPPFIRTEARGVCPAIGRDSGAALRICQLPVAEIGRLPLSPMILFFVLLNGGYLALLTGAGGQTIGKMAFELKVVGLHGEAVPMGRALLRTFALLVSAVPAGLGLASILIDGDRRGLHDRVSRTRVVVYEARS